jgi:hypothetical protein
VSVVATTAASAGSTAASTVSVRRRRKENEQRLKINMARVPVIKQPASRWYRGPRACNVEARVPRFGNRPLPRFECYAVCLSVLSRVVLSFSSWWCRSLAMGERGEMSCRDSASSQPHPRALFHDPTDSELECQLSSRSLIAGVLVIMRVDRHNISLRGLFVLQIKPNIARISFFLFSLYNARMFKYFFSIFKFYYLHQNLTTNVTSP